MERKNHPNRNWRARLRASADQWTASEEAKLLASPIARSPIAERLRLAYLAGLRDGERRDGNLWSIDPR